MPPNPEKTRLLCVIGQLGNGGTERQLHLFLKHRDRSRVEPSVAVSDPSDGVWRRRIAELGVEILDLGGGSQLSKALSFRRILKKFRPDHVFSWSFFANPLCLLSPGTPFTGSLRNSFAHCKGSLGLLRTHLSLLPKRIVVNSSLLQEELKEAGVSDGKMRLIYNIFERKWNFPEGDAEKRRGVSLELRAKYGLPRDAVIVMGAGRNSPTKDFPFFVNIVEESLKSGVDVRSVLIGSGGSAMKEEIDRRGLSGSFLLPGEVPDARELMPMADIFLLSSKDEGMPNVLLEAVDAGCAPLATDVGGVRDILGEAAESFEVETIIGRRDVAEAAKKLCALASAPQLRTEVSSLAAKGLDRFSPDASMRRYMDFIMPKQT